jgi:hypothetical protein
VGKEIQKDCTEKEQMFFSVNFTLYQRQIVFFLADYRTAEKRREYEDLALKFPVRLVYHKGVSSHDIL